ncbi:hypothetical protein AOLI_G00133080 [Acnodon oligacanthus]
MISRPLLVRNTQTTQTHPQSALSSWPKFRAALILRDSDAKARMETPKCALSLRDRVAFSNVPLLQQQKNNGPSSTQRYPPYQLVVTNPVATPKPLAHPYA